jgi:hypothetical protein
MRNAMYGAVASFFIFYFVDIRHLMLRIQMAFSKKFSRHNLPSTVIIFSSF